MTSLPLLSMLVVLPALGAVALSWVRQPARARQVSVGVVALTLALAGLAIVLFRSGAPGPQLVDTWGQVPGLGILLQLGVDGASVVALSLTALLTLCLVAAGPRQALDRHTLAVLLLTESATLGFFCAQDLALLSAFWVATLIPAGVLVSRSARARPESRTLLTFRTYMLAGTLPLLGVTVLLGVLGWRSGVEAPFELAGLMARGVPGSWQTVVFGLLLLAACVRMAVVPFHSWLPVLMGRGPFGLSLLLVNVHAGLFLLVRVVIPLLPEAWAAGETMLGAVGLFCGLYGAVLALAQVDLRRTVGFLLVSQSGLMLAGLATMNTQSVAGVLLQSVAAGVALTGLKLVVEALGARTGTTDMTRLGGLVRKAPRMATFFFLLSFATVGFPGTLSFVGEDLLLHGVLEAHPLVALPLLLTTAICAITLFRAFQKTFLGGVSQEQKSLLDTVEDLLPRERVAALGLFALVFVGGLLPGPLLRVREHEVGKMVGQVASVRGTPAPAHAGSH
ncbi:complex I subunit 4 family protein [Hyalangium rubrum]|uniref:NADH-quinone oxidoreductase subunit M n=1 Tax=Hyalangium rubrum TaxID=3103134 RepID=A0ABU5HD00_9BACT|nr:NADH-quinone oxidoreductase subunit M [Hyalangium sp. s54d21]MDY7231221.1 NADH-quinone oxidoreductase subunit M [Hyalangium sp. s54d21]